MKRPWFIPRFHSFSYPDTKPRYNVAWVNNVVTRSVNVEWGHGQYQAVWTRKAYRS